MRGSRGGGWPHKLGIQRGGPKGVLPEKVEFQMNLLALTALAQVCDGDGVRNEPNREGEFLVVELGNSERDSINRDTALLDQKGPMVGIDLNGQAVIGTDWLESDDGADGIDMAGNEMASKVISGAEAWFEIDQGALVYIEESCAGEGLLQEVEAEDGPID